MQFDFGSGWRRAWKRDSGTMMFRAAEAVLIAGIVWAAVDLFWVTVRPYGPVGRWQADSGAVTAADPSILSTFDPFFRNAGAAGPANVTSLPLKLFGVRIDEAMGRGSAIIASTDGIQNNYAVGEEIVPGVKLKSVAFDNVTIDRGGVSEQLFLDQSVVAPIAAPGAPPVGIPGIGPGGAPSLGPPSLADVVSFSQRVEKGAVTGLVVSPKGPGSQFAALGLQSGDVVTSINGSTIRSAEDAVRAVGASGSVTIVVERGGQTLTLAPKVIR